MLSKKAITILGLLAIVALSYIAMVSGKSEKGFATTSGTGEYIYYQNDPNYAQNPASGEIYYESYPLYPKSAPAGSGGISYPAPLVEILLLDQKIIDSDITIRVNSTHANTVKLIIKDPFTNYFRIIGNDEIAEVTELAEWEFPFSYLDIPSGDYVLLATAKNSITGTVTEARKHVFISHPNLAANIFPTTSSPAGDSTTNEPTPGTTAGEPNPTTSGDAGNVNPVLDQANTIVQTDYPLPVHYDALNLNQDTSANAENSEASITNPQPTAEPAPDRTLHNKEKTNYVKPTPAQNNIKIKNELTPKEIIKPLLKESRKTTKNVTPVPSSSVREKVTISPQAEEKIAERKEAIRKKIRAISQERPIKIDILQRVASDTDNDGISDYDEKHIYGTDPAKTDSDGDGINDGIELIKGKDPLNDNLTAEIIYEDPREIDVSDNDIFSVEIIEVTNVEQIGLELPEVKEITFGGKAPPNSFVTIYIFSTPIIVTVQADENGDWAYILDLDIEDGKHEVHVAITDTTGTIVAKSEEVEFIKRAAAIEFQPTTLLATGDQEKPSFFSADKSFMAGGIIIILVFISLLLIGARSSTLKEKEESLIQ